ncbi:MAG: class I SAM-dependent DNA methyltransferase [Pseudomonadota bacterium]
MDVEYFIQRWTEREGGAERANYQLFLSELCDVLGVPRPEPAGADTARNDYVFERAVRPRASEGGTAPKRIDLYKKNAFILEAKQSRLPGAKYAIPTQQGLALPDPPDSLGRRPRGPSWDAMMQNARRQAEGYVFLLDADQPAPPFIITCDVGHCLEVFADFSGTGRAYNQFPDRNGFRIYMDDLRDEDVRKRLACIWTDPHALDPTRTSARVTREIAKRLAEVSKALEARKCNPEDVAHFLMRCLFTMFAEDTDLLPRGSFGALLEKSTHDPSHFPHRLKALWGQMEKGEEFSHVIEARVRHFNGGLFKDTTAFELGREEIGELLAAARADWRQVDPAIFGTLLEQALDKDERRKLGAHYTPRSYVQRLVGVTVMEPLREDWETALTKAQQARDDGDDKQAVAIVRDFHHRLCTTRVLDPACGTGNFLYVSLEMMKQLEGEVLQTLTDLGEGQGRLAMAGETVDPHQFLGLELNPRAAAIAELVIWIGYLQWHYRNHESHPAEPILRAFNNINFGRREGYDAVLTWDGYPLPSVEEKDGQRVETYPNPRRPEWPEAEFIVGNPPFLGKGAAMRGPLGDGYVDALRAAHPTVPDGVDFVLYWWDRAASLSVVKKTPLRRFGFVTTNSITQTFNRRVVAQHLKGKAPISLVFAIPDHPWTRATRDAASVRIAMTVGQVGTWPGVLLRTRYEEDVEGNDPIIEFSQAVGRINPDLTTGADVTGATELAANKGLSWNGVMLAGRGFVLDQPTAEALLARNAEEAEIIKPFISGRDLVQSPRKRFVIDTFGTTDSSLRTKHPAAYQFLLDTVKPERDVNRDAQFRRDWWLFGRNRPELRQAISTLSRYIGLPETAKHREVQFIESEYLPEHRIVCIASGDEAVLAILSSRAHKTWSLAAGGTLEDRPVYNKSICFDRYPFPSPSRELLGRIGALGEELDATRKIVLAEHPDLTLTGLYNLIEKVKAGAALTPPRRTPSSAAGC